MPADASGAEPAARNHVHLVGRLAAAPEDRTLPSGDRLTVFRVIVPRSAPRTKGRSDVDTIDCVAARAVVRRALGRIPAGTAIDLEGSLHRRFWRAASGPASRYEVEVHVLRRARVATGRGPGGGPT